MRQKKVKFNKTNITVKVGKKAKVTLKNAAKKAKVTWKISNKKVIKLTKKSKKYAVVKGVKKGTTTLKATYKKGKVKKILNCNANAVCSSINRNANNGAYNSTIIDKSCSKSGQ